MIRRLCFVVVVVVAAACEPPPQAFLALPSGLGLAELPASARARLRATVEVDQGGLNETTVDLDVENLSIAGDIALNGGAGDRTLTVRLYDALDQVAEEVLIARLNKAITIDGQGDLHVALADSESFETAEFGVDGRPSFVFDENRNGVSNLEDLKRAVDPAPQASFIDASPSTLQFPSGVRLGTFARQVIVIENRGPHPVRVREAEIVDAPGIALSLYDETGETTTVPRRVLDLGAADDASAGVQILPADEAFIAVTFAPVNSFLTTGAVQLVVIDEITGVAQAARIKLIANPDGALRPAPLGFVPEQLASASVDVGAGSVTVASFPGTPLFSGLPITADDASIGGLLSTGQRLALPSFDGASIVSLPADSAYFVVVPARNRFSTTLFNLASDVDVAVVALDGKTPTRIACDSCVSSHPGESPEGVELANDTDAELRVLVVLGRQELEAPPSIVNGLAAGDAAPYELTAHVTRGPEFDDVTPLSRNAGPLEGGYTITLRGRGFQDGARVTLSGTTCLDARFVHDDVFDTVSCTVQAGSFEAGKNPATIVVENPAAAEGGDGQAATLPEAFTFQPPAPTLVRVAPDVAPTTGGIQPVIVTGSFFSDRNGAPVVTFDDAPATDVVVIDASTLSCLPPIHEAGGAVLRVANQIVDVDGSIILSRPAAGIAFRFAVPDGAAPTIASFSPASAELGAVVVVTIAGADFRVGARVFFGNEEAALITFAPTSLSVSLPDQTDGFDVDVVVVNSDGQSAVGPSRFSYSVPAPSVSSVFPTRASTAGGTILVLRGTGFRGDPAVFFDGADGAVAASNVTRVSTTTLLAETPATGAGPHTLRVVNGDDAAQAATLASSFTFFAPEGPPPRVASVNPVTGPAEGGGVITILGSGFSLAGVTVVVDAVAIGDEDIEGVPRLLSHTNTSLTFDLPPSASGGAGSVPLQVVNSDGQSDSSTFTYVALENAPPRIDAITPDRVSAGGAGSLVTVTGAAFDAEAVVRVGGLVAEVVSSSTTSLTFTARRSAAGVTLVSVENVDGQSAAVPLSFVDAPQISALGAQTVHALVGGDQLLVLGRNLDLIDADADATLDAGNGLVGSAKILTASSGFVILELPALAERGETGLARYRVGLAQAGGEDVVAPTTFLAREPHIVLAVADNEGPSTHVTVIGDFLNPDRLDHLTIDDALDCLVSLASESSVECDVSSPDVAGRSLQLALAYVDPLTDAAVNVPVTVAGNDDGVAVPPASLDFGAAVLPAGHSLARATLSGAVAGLGNGELSAVFTQGGLRFAGVATIVDDAFTIGSLDGATVDGGDVDVQLSTPAGVVVAAGTAVARRSVIGGTPISNALWPNGTVVTAALITSDEQLLGIRNLGGAPVAIPFSYDGIDTITITSTRALAPAAYALCLGVDNVCSLPTAATFSVVGPNSELEPNDDSGSATAFNGGLFDAVIAGANGGADVDDSFFVFPLAKGYVIDVAPLVGLCPPDLSLHVRLRGNPADLLSAVGTAGSCPRIVVKVALPQELEVAVTRAPAQPLLSYQLRSAGLENLACPPTPGLDGVCQCGCGQPDADCAVRACDTEHCAPGLIVDPTDTTACAINACGDGVIDAAEECDDGDTDGGDGCAANCVVENTFLCGSEPSLCLPNDELFPDDANTLARFELNADTDDENAVRDRDATNFADDAFAATGFGRGLHVVDGGLDWSEFADRLTPPFTIEMVVTPVRDPRNFRKIFGFDDDDDAGCYWINNAIQCFEDGKGFISEDEGGGRDVGEGEMGRGDVIGGRRMYLAFVVESATAMRVYADGNFIGVAPPGLPSLTARDVVLLHDDRDRGGEQSDALLDGVRFSRVARDDTEIEAIAARVALASPEPQAELHVTTSNDAIALDGECSLREAVLSMNSGVAGDCGPVATTSTIRLDAGFFGLGDAGDVDEPLPDANVGDLDILAPMKIIGAGADATVLASAGGDRHFEVFASGVLIEGVRLFGGEQTAGGAIFNHGGLTLRSSQLTGNTARAGGGGIFSDGTLLIERSTIGPENVAEAGDGGGILNAGSLTIDTSTIAENRILRGDGPQGSGGGVASSAPSAQIRSSTIARNRTADQGGGLFGIFALSSSIISNNDEGESDDDCSGATINATDAGNFIQDAGGCTIVGAVHIDVDLVLGALQNNGGRLDTIEWARNTVGLDAGVCTSATDERGFPRPIFGGCDPGALELEDLCGNGALDDEETSEECDDGNLVDDDGCQSDCTLPCRGDSGALRASIDPTSGNCLALIAVPRSWDAAELDCEAKGGHLAVPSSAAENARLAELADFGRTWIGLNDKNAEAGDVGDDFVTVTGEPNLNFFSGGEPNNAGNEDCVELAGAGAWNDFACGDTSSIGQYACELEVNPCGNGVRNPAETCDDRDAVAGDGCDSSCQIESGFTCVGSPSVCSLLVAGPCGDGVLNLDEGCDDGGRAPFDGCSMTCQVEPLSLCSGVPSVCTPDPAATVIFVTASSAEDTVAGDCSLREAFETVNTGAAVDACAPPGPSSVEILVPAGNYVLTDGELVLARTNVQVQGTDAVSTSIRASNNARVFRVGNGGVSPINVGIKRVLVTDGDVVGAGGGILVESGADLVLDAVEVSGNVASLDGGGVDNSGTLSVIASTMADNVTLGFGGGAASHDLLITLNSTFTANQGASGGGMFIDASSSGAFISQTTIALNTADNEGGGIDNAGPLTMRDSIVVSNSAESSDDCSALTGTSLGKNLMGADVCFSSLDPTDIGGGAQTFGLFSVDANGTRTLTPLGGSAVEGGTCLDSFGTFISVDQAGRARPIGGQCEIGSVETN